MYGTVLNAFSIAIHLFFPIIAREMYYFTDRALERREVKLHVQGLTGITTTKIVVLVISIDSVSDGAHTLLHCLVHSCSTALPERAEWLFQILGKG